MKMTSLEHDFLEDQKGPRIDYCTSFVDRKWEKTTQRRQKDQLSYKRMKKNEERSRPEAIPWKEQVKVKVQLLVRKTPRKLYMKDELRYQTVMVIS